jgi:hypothetical protein
MTITQRFFVSIRVMALTIIAAVVVVAVPVTGQEATYTAPRTPDGQPDLQGFWSNQTYTPLERPDGVTKEFYTAEEVAEIETGRTQREISQTTPGTIPDVHYDFTQFGLDRSQAGLARSMRTSLIVDPPNGKLPPVTALAEQRAAEQRAARERMGGRWGAAEANELDDRCIIMVGAGPPMLNTGYNSNYQIVQAPGYVMILVEMVHDARIIPLDGRDHPSPKLRQWMGAPRGRWEGETLVVETSNFNGKNPFPNRSSVNAETGRIVPGSGDQMRVTERFTRVAEDQINYEFRVEDPETWARPWSAEMPMQKTNGPIFEHACHEGNYGLYNTLVGNRLEEEQAAAENEAARPDSR